MPFMYSEMQNKLSKTRESPLESMGQIISSRCPITSLLQKSKLKPLKCKIMLVNVQYALLLYNVINLNCFQVQNINQIL